MWKVDQKRNWVKLKSVQTLLSIDCLGDRKSYVVIICANSCEKSTKSENVSTWSQFKYCSKSLVKPIGSHMWSLYVPILSKVYQKRNFVKLKSVRTLLRIACVAYRKSYVVIICASSCEKFTKSDIYSDIAQNHFHISQFDQRSKVIQFKNHEVNWKTIYMYMTSYMCFK